MNYENLVVNPLSADDTTQTQPQLFRNKFRNDTARALWHDYNGGAYFITICTKNREHYFGDITTTAAVDRGGTNRVGTFHGDVVGTFHVR